MYREEIAEQKDVDLILDFKLDIIFNSAEVASLERNEMEKIVNSCEEEIRDSIDKYRLLYDENGNVLAGFMVDDYGNDKIIDFIYVLPEHRHCGIGTYVLNDVQRMNYKPIYAYVYKDNEVAIQLLKSNGFSMIEENEFKYFMKNDNNKEENNQIKIEKFEEEVAAIAKKYGVEYTIETKIL